MATPILDDLDFGALAHLLNVLLQNLTSDPGSPGSGQIWFRSDGKVVKFYDGSAVQTVALVQGDLGAGSVLQSTANVQSIIEAIRLDQMAAPTADVSLNNHKITSLADPSNPQDAVNYRTLLNNVAGLSASQPVVYATAVALPANTYNNGTSGVGATLTGNANGALSVDGAAVAVGQRILVSAEATAANDGIYTVTAAGDGTHPYILTRATDFNASTNIGPGILVPVEAPTGVTAGTANNGKVYISISPTSPTVGTSAITFSSVGGTYSADGTTIQLIGNQFSLVVPVVVASGGTGSTTAAGARSNLGAVGRFASTIGNASATSFTVTHSLGSTDVDVTVWETGGSKRRVLTTTQINDANSVIVAFAAAPATNAYRVVVEG